VLLKTLEAHTPLKYNHTMEVISITEKIVSVMDVSEEERNTIMQVATYHNIGWLEFSKEFCAYEGQYTDDEFSLMRSYPERGAQKLKDNGYNKDIVKSVKLHANNYDSTLPIAARVVRYARDFRKVLSLTEKFPTIHDALQDMKNMSEKAYDPYVVEMAEQAFN